VKSLIDKGVGADFARIYCDEPIAKAVDNMNIKKKGSVLVYNREDKVVGIFTERDFLKNLSKNDPTNLIQDVMTPSSNLIVGKPEWTIRRCQEIMVG
jgi:CBS domain-containing protein